MAVKLSDKLHQKRSNDRQRESNEEKKEQKNITKLKKYKQKEKRTTRKWKSVKNNYKLIWHNTQWKKSGRTSEENNNRNINSNKEDTKLKKGRKEMQKTELVRHVLERSDSKSMQTKI